MASCTNWTETIGRKHDLAAVRSPGEAAQASAVESDLSRLAAAGRHYVYVFDIIDVTHEGDHSPVGRKYRCITACEVGRRRCQPARLQCFERKQENTVGLVRRGLIRKSNELAIRRPRQARDPKVPETRPLQLGRIYLACRAAKGRHHETRDRLSKVARKGN